MLSGVAWGIDRHDNRGGGGGITVDFGGLVHFAGVFIVASLFATEVITWDVDAESFVSFRNGLGYVVIVDLVVDIIVGVVTPVGGVKIKAGGGGSIFGSVD